MRASIRNVAVSMGLAIASSMLFASPAQATAYDADRCSSSGNANCFALFYNSRWQDTGVWASSCFLSNRDIYNFAGYYAGGHPSEPGEQVVYVFDYFDLHVNALAYCDSGAGSGQPVKNNAAAAANETSSTVRVYYNSGYGGPYQTFSPGETQNLNSTLKNDNASMEML